MQTIVIGHKNPDMDAICSAIGYAEFKRRTGSPNAIAARCGNTNERIDFALGRFGFESPAFFSSVRTRVEDVMERSVVFARRHEPVYDALNHIGEGRYRGLPVVGDQDECVGLISSFKISNYLFPPRREAGHARNIVASVDGICATIGCRVVTGEPGTESVEMTLVVAAMQTDSFQRRLDQLEPERTVLIVGDRRNIQRIAVEAGVRVLIITGDMDVYPEIRALAEKNGTTLLVSPHDTATTVLLARGAVQAGQMMYEDFLSVPPELPLKEAQREVALSPQFAFPVLDDQRRLKGILSKSDFLKPAARELILVDHNELTQAVDGADEIPIVEIIDHHRIGAVQTESPILFMNRPVGSTSTIVATMFDQAGIAIPKPLAGLLMCGMISDTLNLTSPTTTEVDRKTMAKLSEISGENAADLAAEIFSVGSPLLTMTPEAAVTADCKEYEARDGTTYSISQIEELSFAHFEEKRAALLAALEEHREAQGYLFSVLLVTDVNTQNSLLLVRGSEAFRRVIDYPEFGENVWRLDGVVSRKKQLLPYLSGLLARIA